MASHQTKLKLGRKLEGVDTSTASDNQVSVLFRYAEDTDAEDHVSVSIESDAMGPEDVFALVNLLEERGILTAGASKTWLHQPKASREHFGETTTWQGTDLSEKISMLKKGLSVRTGEGKDAAARNKQALIRLAELEDQIAELKQSLQGASPNGEEPDASSTLA